MEVVFSSEAPAPIGAYSQAIHAGKELFCSGQIPLDPKTGEIAAGDISAHTEQVLKNLGAVLRAGGFDYPDVVKTTIFLVDMSDFAAVNAVYGKYFDATKPARSTVGVSGLPKGVRIEIDAIAKR